MSLAIDWAIKPQHKQNKNQYRWPIFHGPVILPYFLKTIWCMNIILWDYESVWHDLWSQNKCWSLWPIFHGPVILLCILNSIWWMNVILLENVLWPQNKFRSQWPIIHGPVISLIFCSENNCFIGKARFRWTTLSCVSSYVHISKLVYI